MITLILALLLGAGTGTALYLTHTLGPVWSIVLGVVTAFVVQLGAGLLLRRLITKRMALIQNLVMSGQEKLQRKVNQLQTRPQGSVKQIQKMLETEQRGFVMEALEATAILEPFYLWSFLLEKQITTMRMQFHYQLQEFDKVDELMPKCLFLEPMTACMKMARMYKRKEEGIDAFFEKRIKRLRYGQGAILYALYAWILVKQSRVDEAHKVLIRGCDRAENDILKRNRDHLANNRVRQFSNAGFGDEWYALALETPKMQVKRQRQRGNRPF